jgi:hypothetical protein
MSQRRIHRGPREDILVLDNPDKLTRVKEQFNRVIGKPCDDVTWFIDPDRFEENLEMVRSNCDTVT